MMSAPPPPPQDVGSQPQPQAPAQQQPQEQPQPQPPARPDPGVYDILHAEAKGVMPAAMSFEGARFSFVRMVGQHLQVSHSFNLNKAGDSSYHFAPTYIGPFKRKEGEGLPVILGDVDNTGSIVSQIIHEPLKNLKLKFQAQSKSSQWLGAQLEAEYSGSDFVSSVKFVNSNPLKESGIWVANYLQKMTSNIALGGEIMYQYSPEAESSGMSFAGRYRTKDWTATGTVSPVGMVQASYFHVLNKKSHVATEFEVDLRQGDTSCSIGYQYNFTESCFRGQVTSKGVVCGLLEKQLQPGISLLMSGAIDHMSGDSKFGVGLQVGMG